MRFINCFLLYYIAIFRIFPLLNKILKLSFSSERLVIFRIVMNSLASSLTDGTLSYYFDFIDYISNLANNDFIIFCSILEREMDLEFDWISRL